MKSLENPIIAGMDVLQLNGINKTGRDGFQLKDACFVQATGKKIAIAGETGSGKTTLLKIIAGLIQPDSGIVLFNGQKVIGPLDKLIPGHPQIAYLSQHFELRNNYRVAEILSYANNIADAAAEKIYTLCRINHLLQRKTDQLSGGEKQRIAIARLLIGAPKLLILDEPFSNLDFMHKQLLKSVLQDLGRELGISFLLSSHDPLDTLSWADEILVMRAGEILQRGTAEAVYRRPLNEYVGGLFGNYSIIGDAMAAQYPELFKGITPAKKAFIRPEQFSIQLKPGSGIPATVVAVHFQGSYFDITLQAAGQEIIARSASGSFTSYSNVYILFEPDEIWYV